MLHELLLHLLFICHQNRDASTSTTIALVVLGVHKLTFSLVSHSSPGLPLVIFILFFRVQNSVDRVESSVFTKGVGGHSLPLGSRLYGRFLLAHLRKLGLQLFIL